MKVHLIDKSKTGWRADTGTVCGIRLQYRIGTDKYFARALGQSEFTEPRNVVGLHRFDDVTCQSCINIICPLKMDDRDLIK